MSAPAPLTVVVSVGAWGTTEYAILTSGKVPAQVFLNEEGIKVTAKFFVLFQQLSNYGVGGVPPKRFKKEMGKFFAFRLEIDNRQLRLPCFFDGNRCILTGGFVKPGVGGGMGKWPRAEVERAGKVMAEYLQRKKQAEKSKGKK